jgi:uroporphyrinogen-III synthase
VETRIRKVESGEYDGTLLAGAGVLRLGLAGKISEWLELSDFLPAPGQGAIAIQCRTTDRATRDILAEIDEPALRAETDAERGFLRALGGGCSAPVGAFAQSHGSRLRLRGRVSALDGSRSVDVENEGEDHAALVAELAERALREGAADLISSAGGCDASQPRTASSLRGPRVLVTRARGQADDLCARLAESGAVPVAVPMIRITPLEDTRELDAAIESLASYLWLIFASANAVEFFMKRRETMQPGTLWGSGAPRVAAVGPGTMAALSRHGVGVDFAPSEHTGIALAEGILGIAGEELAGARVLMPRALHGREDGAALLRRHGAVVDEVPIYRTEPLAPSAIDLSVLDGEVDAVLFTSSSAVNAWCEQFRQGGRLAEAAHRAIIACIGPSTASTARDRGLHVHVEASAHTAEGLVAALERYFASPRGGTQ